MIDQSEYGAYILLSYADDLCQETAYSMENVKFIIDTEQRFRNMLDEELSENLWVAHAKDLHMWYYTGGEKDGQIDEEGLKKCAAHKFRMNYLAEMWQHAAFEGDKEKCIINMDVSVTASHVDYDRTEVVNGNYRPDAVKWLYTLNIMCANDEEEMDDEGSSDVTLDAGDDEVFADNESSVPKKGRYTDSRKD